MVQYYPQRTTNGLHEGFKIVRLCQTNQFIGQCRDDSKAQQCAQTGQPAQCTEFAAVFYDFTTSCITAADHYGLKDDTRQDELTKTTFKKIFFLFHKDSPLS